MLTFTKSRWVWSKSLNIVILWNSFKIGQNIPICLKWSRLDRQGGERSFSDCVNDWVRLEDDDLEEI